MLQNKLGPAWGAALTEPKPNPQARRVTREFPRAFRAWDLAPLFHIPIAYKKKDHVLAASPILLADANSEEILLFQKACRTWHLGTPHVVSTGYEAIYYLDGAGRYGNRVDFPFPTLFVLDLKLPGLDGFEVLSWVRQQPQFKQLRVVVLTTPETIRDVTVAYQLGANSFLVKPLVLEDAPRLIWGLGHSRPRPSVNL